MSLRRITESFTGYIRKQDRSLLVVVIPYRAERNVLFIGDLLQCQIVYQLVVHDPPIQGVVDFPVDPFLYFMVVVLRKLRFETQEIIVTPALLPACPATVLHSSLPSGYPRLRWSWGQPRFQGSQAAQTPH